MLVTKKKLNRIFKNLYDYRILEKKIFREFGHAGIKLWDNNVSKLNRQDNNLSLIKVRKLTVKIFEEKFVIK